MDNAPSRIAVVGFGPAGLSCAQTLRAEGYAGALHVFSAETALPYERPALSKAFLTGASATDIGLLPDDGLSGQSLTLRLGETVERVEHGSLVTRSGSEETFDRILLATGLIPRELPGDLLDGTPTLHALRDLADAGALREQLLPGREIVLIGGGYIGLEVAATAVALGCSVTVVEMGARLLARSAPPMLADWLMAKHAANGVRFRLGMGVERVMDVGQRTLVKLTTGETLTADCVLVGIGGVPCLPDLPDGVMRSATGGLVVDEAMKTGVPGLFAAGDIAEAWNATQGCRIRPEAWQSAELQGAAAARGMLGLPTEPFGTNWFWTDQYDANIQMLGDLRSHDRVILRGDPAEERFTAFLLTGDVVTGAVFVNSGRDVRPTRKAIDARLTVDAAALTDADAPLRQVLAA